MRTRPSAVAAALLAITFTSLGCGASPADPPTGSASASASVAGAPSAAAAAITIDGFAFDPPTLAVAPGTTVTWTNAEDAFHTVTAGTPEAPSGLFDSGEFDTGDTFSFSFDAEGRYPFFCARHDFMTGEVVVGP